MFCNVCGTANLEHGNYCFQDGAVLPKTNKRKQVGLSKKNSLYCSNCGGKSRESDNYCSVCGSSIIDYQQSEAIVNTTSQIKKAEKSSAFGFFQAFNLILAKKAVLPSLIAIAIMLLLSLAVYLPMKGSFDGAYRQTFNLTNLTYEEMAYYMEKDLPDPGSIYGFTDTVMSANFAPPTYFYKMSGYYDGEKYNSNGTLGLTFNPVILFIIPVIGLIIAGVFLGRKLLFSSIMEKFAGSVIIGLIYGLFISLFSLFSGFSYHVAAESEGNNFSVMFDTSFPFIQLLFTGIVAGCIFSFIGSLFALDFRRFTSHLHGRIPFGLSIHNGFFAFVKIYSLFAVLFTGIMAANMSAFRDNAGAYSFDLGPFANLLENSTFFAINIGPQVASYALGIVHFIPLSLSGVEESGYYDIGYSLLSGFYANGTAVASNISGMEAFLNMNNLSLYLRLSFLIPVLCLIWSGFSMSNKGQSSLSKIAVFSLTYGIFMTFLSVVSIISLKLNNFTDSLGTSWNKHFTLEINSISIFFTSFLFAFLFAYIGHFAAKWKSAN